MLEATERDVLDRENRLTEILAAVLLGAPDLAAELMTINGLAPGMRYEISTQVSVDSRSVDLEVLAIDGHRVVSRLWGEHKVGAGFGADQVATYARLLSEQRVGVPALMLVAPSERLGALKAAEPDTGLPVPTRWLSWLDIGVATARVGRRRGGVDWRDRAFEPDAQASQLLLAELLAALERRDLANMDPLSLIDVMVLANAKDARDNLLALFERAAQHLDRLSPTDSRSRRTSDFNGWWIAVDGPKAWPRDDYAGWSEYYTRDTDSWRSADDAMDVPCFGAGYTFGADDGAELLGEPLERWRETLASHGVEVVEDGQWVRCVATLYFNDIVTAGVTLDDQAAHVAQWIDRTIATIDANPPAPT